MANRTDPTLYLLARESPNEGVWAFSSLNKAGLKKSETLELGNPL